MGRGNRFGSCGDCKEANLRRKKRSKNSQMSRFQFTFTSGKRKDFDGIFHLATDSCILWAFTGLNQILTK
ncbi:Uncharacterized protein TCM_037093 [Theobroma cacao]|uniref:Uncharacterized protein n=1 Tax=Theobroma cacao TaxID=3641 RepID=A0A061GR42_THECC|nr:Uncharacterized protein TCM_037093 [Theobroma cacao]